MVTISMRGLIKVEARVLGILVSGVVVSWTAKLVVHESCLVEGDVIEEYLALIWSYTPCPDAFVSKIRPSKPCTGL